MRRLGLAISLASLLLAGGVSQGAAAKVPRAFYGVVPNTTLGSGDFARMADANVGTLRFAMYWPGIQGSRGGGINLSGIDPTVEAASENSINMLPILFGTPQFEQPGCKDPACSRRLPKSSKALGDWKGLLKGLVTRYGPRGSFWQGNSFYDPITEWQIWNEENNPVEKAPARRYARFVKVSAKAIHSVDPKAKIILGGMFGEPPGDGKSFAWKYLGALYKAGAKPYFDGVALHPYAPKISGIADQVERSRKVMQRNHDDSARIYITEIGWGSSKKKHPGTGGRGAAFNVGAKEQKQNLTAAFRLLTSHRSSWGIGGVDWFSWKDPKNPPPGLCAFCYSSGLYKANGKTAKPALGAFKAFTRKTK